MMVGATCWLLTALLTTARPSSGNATSNAVWTSSSLKPPCSDDLGTTGEDHAGIHLEDDVRCARVGARIVELVAQGLAGEYFLDAERLLIRGLAQVAQPPPGPATGSVSQISDPSSEISNASAVPMVAAGWPPPMPRRLLRSIGDWPCLALMMISVESNSLCAFSSLHEAADRLVDEIELARQRLPRRARAHRYNRP